MRHFFIFFLLLTQISLNPIKGFAQNGDPIKQKELLASKYMSEGDYEKAFTLYKEIFPQRPTAVIYENYLKCLVELKDYNAAERLIRTMKKKQGGYINTQVELGYLYELSGDARKSEKKYQQALKSLKSGVSQAHQLANAFQRRRKMDFSIQTYLKARELNQNKELFAFQLINLYFSSGNYKALVEEYIQLLELSPKYDTQIKQYLKFQLSNNPDDELNSLLKNELLEKSNKKSRELQYSEMLYWYSLQMSDFEMALLQAKALDIRMQMDGEMVFNLGKICLDNNEYKLAIESFQHIIDRYGEKSFLYDDSRVYLLNTRFQNLEREQNLDENQIVSMKKSFLDLLNELGRNNTTIDLIINLAHLHGFYLNELETAQLLLEQSLNIPNLQPNQKARLKMKLADLFLLKDEEWEAILLFSQLEKEYKGQDLAYDAKLKRARTYYFLGEFDWALMQLDILKSSTTRFISNDALDLSLIIKDNIDFDSSYVPLEQFAAADLIYFKRDYKGALEKLTILQNLYPAHPIIDDILYKKGLIYLETKEYEMASKEFEKITIDYGFDIYADNALFQLGTIYEEKIKDIEKAKVYYEKIILDYPGSIFNVEAAKRYRILRGDQIN